MRVLATYGNWQAKQDGRRYLVVDLRSGIQFNCNSASHAVKKAKDNQMRDAQAFVESPIARELLGPETAGI